MQWYCIGSGSGFGVGLWLSLAVLSAVGSLEFLQAFMGGCDQYIQEYLKEQEQLNMTRNKNKAICFIRN